MIGKDKGYDFIKRLNFKIYRCILPKDITEILYCFIFGKCKKVIKIAACTINFVKLC